MKVLRLNSEQISSLLAQAESGMGFQVVEVDVAYVRSSEPWLVFGSEIAIAFNEPGDLAYMSSRRDAGSLEWLQGQASDPGELYGTPRVVSTRSGIGLYARAYGTSQPIAATPLSLLKTSRTISNARYARFSAFRNDRRVDPLTGAFLPGTYATTIVDQPLAPSGFSAVGRYALPNVMPASFVHLLTASSGTVIYSGTVAPAYGQSGGGVEVYFPNGVSNTAAKMPPLQIPDE
jgi:hypothetical protein